MAKRTTRPNKSKAGAGTARQREALVLIDQIEPLILTIRDQKVLLDRDLAALYNVPTRRLNETGSSKRQAIPSSHPAAKTHVGGINSRRPMIPDRSG
jgi:hypothetical protein